VTFFYGVSREEEGTLASLVPAAAERVVVPDRGTPGRVVAALAARLAAERDAAAAICCNIGPPALMQRAAEAEEAAGVPPARILSSLETPSLCGVGICGLCEAGGRLLCREGTFVGLDAIREAGGWDSFADDGH
jgi:dihydroorotate dehydrogenase (NAD+) catalytic subunit